MNITGNTEKIDAIIFDLDGTLFQTERVAVNAFQQTFRQLKDQGVYQGELPSREEIMSMFGKTLHEIWEALLPGQDTSVKTEADDAMLKEELRLISEGKGELYPQVFDTLQLLSSQFPLFVASNGRQDYVEAACRKHNIYDFFKGIYTAGAYQVNKVELVAQLLKKNQVKRGVMVGDRQSDVEAGRKNNLYVIGCLYGYGTEDELTGAHARVDAFGSIREMIRQYLGSGKVAGQKI